MKKNENISIVVVEKPEYISFDNIHEVLWRANKDNRNIGFILKTSELSDEQLKARLGTEGKCFVALDKDCLIGTISVRFFERKTWYAMGKVADYMLAAVVPEYQNQKVNSLLSERVFSFAREKGCSVIELDTAENNKKAINVYKHYGFKLVGYKANPGGDHYSVIMAKWLNKCPFSDLYCLLRFEIKKIITVIRFTPDKKKRFAVK